MAAPILSYEGLGLIQGEGWLFRGLDVHIGARTSPRSMQEPLQVRWLRTMVFLPGQAWLRAWRAVWPRWPQGPPGPQPVCP